MALDAARRSQRRNLRDRARERWSMPPAPGSATCSTASSASMRRASVRLVKGSHIVTERLFDHDRCYIFQNDDGRVFFAIPYERDFTLIGTTDLDYSGDPGAVAASDEEIDYLCKAASDYFRKPVTRESGEMDLFRRASAVRRRRLGRAGGDARLCAEDRRRRRRPRAAQRVRRQAHDLSPAGGIGARACWRRICRKPDRPDAWTAKAPLPGGDFPVQGFEALVEGLARALSRVSIAQTDPQARARLWHARRRNSRRRAARAADLGRDFGAGLTEAEINYLVEQRMGDDGAGRRLAPLKARPADSRRPRSRRSTRS